MGSTGGGCLTPTKHYHALRDRSARPRRIPVHTKCTLDQLDEVLSGAKEHGIKLVLLWFAPHKKASGRMV